MSSDFLGDRRRALEESFFARKDHELMESMRAELETKERKEALAEVCGISDAATLDQLVTLDLSVETVAALSMIPLIEVAWSDGTMGEKEKEAILSASLEQGISSGSAAGELLKSWLASKPEPALLEAWKDYVQALGESLDATAKAAVHDVILSRARAVAEAAGGILGLGSKVSASEQAVLDELEAAIK